MQHTASGRFTAPVAKPRPKTISLHAVCENPKCGLSISATGKDDTGSHYAWYHDSTGGESCPTE